MGGAIGMVAAAGRLRGRIERLVLNDIGPQVAEVALDRIRSYAGNPAAFATVSELEQYFRTVYRPYGFLTDAQWRRLTETSTRRLPDGRVTPHYDPAMVQQFIHHPQDHARWADDEGDDLLAPLGARPPDHRHLGDRRVLQQHFLDLARIDVAAAADDHVLGAVLQRQEAVAHRERRRRRYAASRRAASQRVASGLRQ
jgi:hypothetical protein